MTLQAKFAVLIGLLGSVVLGSVAIALWNVPVTYRSMSTPLAQDARTMRRCGEIAQHLRTIEQAVDAGNAEAPHPAIEQIGLILDTLSDDPRNQRRAQGLRVVVDELRDAARRWNAVRDDEAKQEAARLVTELDDRVTQYQTYILRNADLYQEYGDQFEGSMQFILGVSLILIVLTCMLALSLLRRWVVTPIGELRAAAAKIGEGDYTHRVNVEGQDEIARLGHEVNHMTSMVQTMQNERVERERLAAVGELVRRLAHNLRNPLAGIRGLAELTRNDLDEYSDLRENQERIIRTVDRFEQWLSDLLGATTPLQIRPVPFELRPWLHDVLDAQRPAAEMKRLDLRLESVDVAGEVLADARHLEQAIVVLVSNAIDATPAGGEIRVGAEMVNNANAWTLTVADTGPGIADDVREKIFNPYFTTKADGSGIGLTVARQIVKGHGGTISLESSRDGTTFLVRLPVRTEPVAGTST